MLFQTASCELRQQLSQHGNGQSDWKGSSGSGGLQGLHRDRLLAQRDGAEKDDWQTHVPRKNKKKKKGMMRLFV